MAAPLWANHVAHTGPNEEHTVDTVTVNGEEKDVVTPEGKPIGPQWFGAGGKFFLGADSRLGRDEMVRLMYGGRTSLEIGITAALIATIIAVVLALLAGYFGGWVDGLIARTLDVIWSLPVFLIGLSLGIALAVGGLKLGPLEISSGSNWNPIFVISIFTVPNLASTIIVFFTLMIANSMLFEAGLSFLGAGVQPPNSSWGTMITVGVELLNIQPLLAIVPGLMIMLTVLSL